MRVRLTLLSLLSLQFARGQLYDKTWVVGIPACRTTFDSLAIDTFQFLPYIGSQNYWAAISDKDGTFQFFTEGVNVYCADGTRMANGAYLSDSIVNADYPYGLPDEQNVLILPKNNHQYYILYQSVDDFNYNRQGWQYTTRLYCSLVDMALQNGQGEVVEKRTLLNGNNFMDGHLTACQHANGNDWWVVQRRYNFNSYFIYLLTSDTITFVREQSIGAVSREPDAYGQSAFSPDGSRYASITAESDLIVLDFDRCAGEFSNPKRINVPIDTFMFSGAQRITFDGGLGLCFSSNGRFIYYNNAYFLRQYDLSEDTIDHTEKVIFFWSDTNQEIGLLNQMHLGPDGKIYIEPYQGFTHALHVIKYPDSIGVACQFEKWGLPISTNNACASSNMPHFRMGPLQGSVCDTITALRDEKQEQQGKELQIRIYPNPASDVIDIDLMQYSQYHPEQQFCLYDAQGRLVKQVALPYLSAQLKVNDLAAGVYHWRLAVGNQDRGTGKLEVVR